MKPPDEERQLELANHESALYKLPLIDVERQERKAQIRDLEA